MAVRVLGLIVVVLVAFCGWLAAENYDLKRVCIRDATSGPTVIELENGV
jgi:hypothetical protein